MSTARKSLFSRIDGITVLLYVLLVTIGLLAVFSVEHRSTDVSIFMSNNITKGPSILSPRAFLKNPLRNVDMPGIIPHQLIDGACLMEEKPLGIINSNLRKRAPIDLSFQKPAPLVPETCKEKFLLRIDNS